ncbi:MAG: protein kinase, partial [Planctomycetota bacterium]
KQIPVGQAVQLFTEICIALRHCHDKGVLHCDLKPANVLLDEDGGIRLADFGQSRLSNEQKPALGTLFYMAPEQADLEAVPQTSWDVYAAGAILYRMLTGVAPHRDETLAARLDTSISLADRLLRYREVVQNSEPLDGHRQNRSIDRPLSQIIDRALSIDPQQRYRTVHQMLQDLERREEIRRRRPLWLLGIVGPLLILLVTGAYGLRTIRSTSERTQQALKREARQSNQLAASYAAISLQSEIRRYYDVAVEESGTEELRSMIGAILNDAELSDALTSIQSMGTPSATQSTSTHREKIIDSALQRRLRDYLTQRLSSYSDGPTTDQPPRVSTIFVTDSVGTILSIAYDRVVERANDSTGRNYAYRTYFHGGKVDLNSKQLEIGSTQPIESTLLSAAFPSTATGLWKVAVSTPVFLEPDGEDRSPDALLVITINLSDLQLLRADSIRDHLAVLVEARPGDQRGTILQHPLMQPSIEADPQASADKQDANAIETRSSSKSLATQPFQIDANTMDQLSGGGDVIYQDPLGETAGGKDYAGGWLAAIQPVQLPGVNASSTSSNQADLLILVQYRLDNVLSPVQSMQKTLLIETLAALGMMTTAMLGLWWWVWKSQLRTESKDQSNRIDDPNIIRSPTS